MLYVDTRVTLLYLVCTLPSRRHPRLQRGMSTLTSVGQTVQGLTLVRHVVDGRDTGLGPLRPRPGVLGTQNGVALRRPPPRTPAMHSDTGQGQFRLGTGREYVYL